MVNHHARASLISLCAAALISAIHHVIELGPAGAAIGVLFIAAAYGLLFWFKTGHSRAALIAYALLNVWMVVGFGLVHGFVEHTVPLAAPSHSVAALDPGPPIRGLTGFTMAIAAVWVAVSSWKFLSAVADSRAEGAAAMERPPLLPAAVSAVLLAAVVGAAAHSDARSLRIAIVAPLTGPNAVLTQSFLRAAEMARDDLGPEARRIRLVLVDSTGSPEQARLVVDQAFRAGRIDAVLGAVSATGQFTAPRAREARIPHICICSVRTIGDGRFNFTNIPLPEDEAVRWVAEAKRRGVRTIAILAQEETSIRNHADAMAREARNNGIRIVLDRRFAGETPDLALLGRQARAANADLVFAEAFPPLIDRLVRELRGQGVTSLASIVVPSVANDPRALEGVWYTDTNLADPDFQRRFEARFPGTRFAAHMTPYAYDSFKLLARALVSGGDPAAYVRGVTRYDGVAGAVTREPGSGNFRSRPAVWVIEDGRPRLLQP